MESPCPLIEGQYIHRFKSGSRISQLGSAKKNTQWNKMKLNNFFVKTLSFYISRSSMITLGGQTTAIAGQQPPESSWPTSTSSPTVRILRKRRTALSRYSNTNNDNFWKPHFMLCLFKLNNVKNNAEWYFLISIKIPPTNDHLKNSPKNDKLKEFWRTF